MNRGEISDYSRLFVVSGPAEGREHQRSYRARSGANSFSYFPGERLNRSEWLGVRVHSPEKLRHPLEAKEISIPGRHTSPATREQSPPLADATRARRVGDVLRPFAPAVYGWNGPADCPTPTGLSKNETQSRSSVANPLAASPRQEARGCSRSCCQ